MTEKRFILHEHDSYDDAIEDTVTGDWLDSSYQYTEKLNELHEENEQLKQDIENMAFILRQNGLGLMEDDD